MLNINFLPWRENLRLKKQKEDKNKAIYFILLFIFILFAWHFYLRNELTAQHKLNLRLVLDQRKLLLKKSELEKLEDSNAKINMLLNEILQLKKKLSQNEKIFVEISKSIPRSVILTAFLKNENVITIVGEAKTMQSIADILQNMSRSNFFIQPTLKEIKNNNSNHIFKIETKLY